MDHIGALGDIPGRGVFELESLGKVEIELDGGDLPTTTYRILDMHVDLGPVEGTLTFGDLIGNVMSIKCLGERFLGDLPLIRITNRLLGACAQFGLEFVESKVPQPGEHKVEMHLQLVLHLILGAESVGIVHRHPANPEQTLNHAGLLIAVDGAKLTESHREVAIGPALALVDEDMEGAVHRLDPVLRIVTVLHPRVHALGEVVQMPRGPPQLRLGEMGCEDEVEPKALMHRPAVILDDLPQLSTLGVPDGESGAKLWWEAEEIQLRAQPPMVPLLGLFEPMQICLEVLVGRPGGPVYALKLLPLLVSAPVGA